MRKSVVYGGIIVLSLIALLLGASIYQQSTSKKPSIPVPQQNTKNTTGSQKSNPSQQTTTSSSEEIKLVQNFPSKDATLQERIEYSRKLAQFEKQTDFIQITNCIPYPFFSRVKENTDLKIKNNDNIEHTILIGNDPFKLPASGTISTKVGRGDVQTNLGCSTGSPGLIHIFQTQ